MIPVRLVLKGLYSYRKEQVIDFERLLEGQLFGIFGGVGSGKSTILEAISFALYDQTERLNLKDKRNYNMMNLKSDELLIDFVFKAGENDQKYRVKVEAKRKKNRDEVNPFTRNSYIWENGKWVAETINVEEIIGLSYENFRRTIIIPQGKFQEFLQLTDGERVKMMKEIFQLKRFDLSDKVNRLNSKNNLEKENLLGQLTGLEEVDAEVIEEKEKAGKELKQKVEHLSENLEKRLKEEKEQERLKSVFESLQKESEKLNTLKSKEDEFASREKHLNEYEKINRTFGKDLSKRKDLLKKKEALSHEVETLKKKFLQVESGLSKEEEKFKNVGEQYNNREQWRQQGEELETYLKVLKLEESVKELQGLAADKENLLTKQSEELKSWEEREKAGYKKLEETRKNLPDLDELYKVKSWFDANNSIQKSLKELKGQGEQLRNKLLSINKDVDSCIEQHLKVVPQLKEVEGKGDVLLQGILQCVKGFDKELEELRKETETLLAHQKLEEFVEELHEGKACPLCGSESHPKVMDVEKSEGVLQELQEKRRSVEEKKSLVNDLYQKVAAYNSSIEANEPILADNESKLEESLKLLAEHKEGFVWEKFIRHKEEEVDKAIESAKEQAGQERKILQGIEQVRQKQQDLRSEKENLNSEVSSLKEKLSAAKSQVTTLTESLKLIKREKADLMPWEEIKLKAQKLFKQYEEVEVQYRELESLVNRLRQEKSELSGSLIANEKQFTSISQELNEVDEELEGKLKETTFNSLPEVEKLLQEDLDVEKERESIRAFREQVFSLQQQLENLKEQLKEKSFDPESYQKLLVEIKELKGEYEQTNKELIELNREIENLKKDLDKKEKLRKKLDEVNQRGDNLKTMANLFRGNGFVNYISSKYLVNLCNAANDRFYKLTRQQLRLELSENNDFQVRDFLNNGKLRSVKTLSGGQTFQASLCLALALADSIQQQNKSKQNFFFLDEGFGSQDKDSLRLVFDALKSLRKENRIVGIISHVEELQQEIDVSLKIRNDVEEGSIVSQSWG